MQKFKEVIKGVSGNQKHLQGKFRYEFSQLPFFVVWRGLYYIHAFMIWFAQQRKV